RVFEPVLGVFYDARVFLQELLAEARRRNARAEVDTWRALVGQMRWTMPRREDFDSPPIKTPGVYKEIKEVFDENTYFVPAIGLYQIWGGQRQKAYKPRRYQICGQAGPLGWEVPAAIGVKKALKNTEPDTEVVGIV